MKKKIEADIKEFEEICVQLELKAHRARAQARGLETQANDYDREWNTTVGVINYLKGLLE